MPQSLGRDQRSARQGRWMSPRVPAHLTVRYWQHYHNFLPYMSLLEKQDLCFGVEGKGNSHVHQRHSVHHLAYLIRGTEGRIWKRKLHSFGWPRLPALPFSLIQSLKLSGTESYFFWFLIEVPAGTSHFLAPWFSKTNVHIWLASDSLVSSHKSVHYRKRTYIFNHSHITGWTRIALEEIRHIKNSQSNWVSISSFSL